MTISLTDTEFFSIAGLLNEKLGFYFPLEKKNNFAYQLSTVGKSLGFKTEAEFKKYLFGGLTYSDLLKFADYMTVGETYFFRESKILDKFKSELLPAVLQSGATDIKIWSAACSTGEEAYSIAMLISEMGNNLSGINLRLYGTDINSVFIEKARKGEYRPWSFRNISEQYVDKYFDVLENNIFKIKSIIRKKVEFTNINLIDPIYPSPFNIPGNFDFIFLRNVLIYFDRQSIDRILTRMSAALRVGGFLITGISELPLISDERLKKMDGGAATYFTRVIPGRSKRKTVRIFNNEKMIKHIRDAVSERGTPNPTAQKKEKIEINKIDVIEFKNQIESKFNSGEYDEVVRLFDSTGYLNKNNIDDNLIIFYLKSLANSGDTYKAERACKNVLEKRKLDAECYYLLSVLQNEMGNYAEAAKNLEKALYLKPVFPMAHFLLANLRLKQNNNEQAIKEFKNTIYSISVLPKDKALDEADGLTAGRLRKIAEEILERIK